MTPEVALALATQSVLSGLTTGAIYGLVGIGFVLVFQVSGVVNLFHGESIIIGGLTAIWLTASMGWPFPLAVGVAVILVAAIGLVLDRAIIQPRIRAEHFTLVLLTLALSRVLYGASNAAWGVHPYTLAPFSGHGVLEVGRGTLTYQALWILGLLVVVAGALWFFFNRTLVGKAMRACAIDPNLATLVGINTNTMIMIAFAAGGAIAALTGIFMAPVTFMAVGTSLGFTLKGFVAGVLGGWGSYIGAVFGGILLGVAEAFAATFGSSYYQEALAFLLLIAVLLVRPQGLLGRARA